MSAKPTQYQYSAAINFNVTEHLAVYTRLVPHTEQPARTRIAHYRDHPTDEGYTLLPQKGEQHNQLTAMPESATSPGSTAL